MGISPCSNWEASKHRFHLKSVLKADQIFRSLVENKAALLAVCWHEAAQQPRLSTVYMEPSWPATEPWWLPTARGLSGLSSQNSKGTGKNAYNK